MGATKFKGVHFKNFSKVSNKGAEDVVVNVLGDDKMRGKHITSVFTPLILLLRGVYFTSPLTLLH